MKRKKIQYQYLDQIDKIKKINKNKLDLIRGKYPEFIHNDENSSILNSQSQQFIISSIVTINNH